jgi:tRNA/tmRNA/rRNA uracil-C5-methylase (TrmA/RlmC/RlmD family)
VAAHLNYLIVRGSYSEQAVIFNVDKLDGPMVRKLKMLADHLQKLSVTVASAFIFFDPSRSDYYLESRRPDEPLTFKKLFGVEQLAVAFEDCRYMFHPTSFSQVNAAMVPVMLRQARALLRPSPDQQLMDLYCGYGLFSHFLAPDFKQVLGIDAGVDSVRAATANGRFNSKRGGRTKFMAHRITSGFLAQLLNSSAAPDAVLLDPPRQGPQAGVIPALSASRPRAVLHIFCGVDQIPAALKEWRTGGYEVRRVVPLDMFPGTINLEVMILLAPKGKAGKR